MPIEYRIDPVRRIVFARAFGTLTDQEVFGYQLDVWSRPDVAGYDELIDMSLVEQVAIPATDRVRQLAQVSSAMDQPTGSRKFAIVAPKDFHYGLGRMYATYRELEEHSTKQVEVFRAMADALKWLGIEEPGQDANLAHRNQQGNEFRQV